MKKLLLLVFVFLFATSAYAGSKEVKQAEQFIQQRRFPQAISLLNEEIKKNNANARAHFLLGKSYLAVGNFSAAEQRFVDAEAFNAKFRSEIAEAYKDAGTERLLRGEIVDAVNLHEQALWYNANLRKVIASEYKAAAKNTLERGYVQDARGLYTKAIQYAPELVQIATDELFAQGVYFLGVQPERAEEVFSAAIYWQDDIKEKVCDTYFEAGKAGRNKTDFELLETAKKYCDRHNDEVLEIMIAKLPGKTIKVQLNPGEIYDVAEVKAGQKWRYLAFSDLFGHRVQPTGRRWSDRAGWDQVSNNLPWNADASGQLQIQAKDKKVEVIINLEPFKNK